MTTTSKPARRDGREHASRASQRLMTHQWTTADTEAARFVSGCIAAGALLGLLSAGATEPAGRPSRPGR